jgi:hypothetical protein
MKLQTLTIGPAPAHEHGASSGGYSTPDSQAVMRAVVFSRMLSRHFPHDPGLFGNFVVMTHKEAGRVSYVVSLVFDSSTPAGWAWALFVDAETPRCWDETARRELAMMTSTPSSAKQHARSGAGQPALAF